MASPRPTFHSRPQIYSSHLSADIDMTPILDREDSEDLYSPIGKSWEDRMRTSWFSSSPERESVDVPRCPPAPSPSPAPDADVPLSTVNAMETAAVWEILPVLLAEQQRCSFSFSDCSEPPDMIFDDNLTPSDDMFPDSMDFFTQLEESLAMREDTYSSDTDYEDFDSIYHRYEHQPKLVSREVAHDIDQMRKSAAFVRARRSTPEFERMCHGHESPTLPPVPTAARSSTMLPNLLCPPRSSSLPKDNEGNYLIFPIACSTSTVIPRADWAIPKRPAPSPPPFSHERSFFEDDDPPSKQHLRGGSLTSMFNLKKHDDDDNRPSLSKTMKDVLRCRWIKRNHSM